MQKAVFVSSCLTLILAACGGDGGSPPPPISIAPTPSPAPTPTPTPSPTPTPTQFVLSPDIAYGSGATTSGATALQLDVYRPQLACDSPRPTVVFVHGGGFTGGSRKGANVEAIAQELTRRGINLLSISYRLQGDNTVISSEFAAFERDFQALNALQSVAQVTAFTAAVEDTVRALRWAVSNAGTYCIDPARFGVWGGSAGAITAMHVAYSLDEYAIPRPSVRVAVDYWGALLRVSDLEAGATTAVRLAWHARPHRVLYQRAADHRSGPTCWCPVQLLLHHRRRAWL